MLCAVVLSYRNEDTVIDAVGSLLTQGVPIEIVVSHSGGGRTPELLAAAYPSVRVLASERRRFPGEARNVGVRATSAPYVSFLAADCIALPGWAEGRLRRHLAGAEAVASALAPAEEGLISLAAHLFQNSVRLAHLTVSPRLRYGVSYSREVLERHGAFPETAPFGEDGWFNDRLIEAGVDIVPAADVVAAHRYPTSVRGLLADQFRRGRHRGTIQRGLLPRLPLVAGTVLTPALALARASHPASPIPRRALAAASPMLMAGGVIAAAGAVAGDRSVADSSPELASLRRRMWTRRLLAGRSAAR